MTRLRVDLGDQPLTWDTLEAAFGARLDVRIAPAALERVARGRGWVDALLACGDAVYGVNTGFGHLKNKRISADQLDRLQENLLISHAVGVGAMTPLCVVRWMLLLKLNMLLAGHSGVRPLIVERLAALLNHDLLPVVPSRGSLGASGDLAPLAHLFLPLIGRGQVCSRELSPAPAGGSRREEAGERWAILPSATALRELRLPPVTLAAKEGLALINGTQFMSAYAAQVGVRARRLADLADLIVSTSIEALQGSVRPMDARLHALRPHAGAIRTAERIRHHLRDSEILAAHAGCDKVQDPYSLRCAPQVHGAFRDALTHFCDVVQREINSVTDNPLLFGNGAEGEPEAVSGGAFHGEPLALVMDYLAIALTEMANISERRTYLLLSGEDGLPKLLMRDTGINSGFMLPQYTSAALVNECKVLASPASTDSIPTSLGQEDHVSMGATSALKLYEIIDRVETVLAIELLCAAQALDFRLPLRAGAGPRRALELVRRDISHADADREFGQDIQASLRLLRESAELLAIARE